MTTFGGLPASLAVRWSPACWLPTWRSFPRRSRVIVAALVEVFGRRGLLARVRRVGRRRELGRQYVWDGFPLGAARLQPGHVAADRAGGQPRRRLRPLGAASPLRPRLRRRSWSSTAARRLACRRRLRSALVAAERDVGAARIERLARCSPGGQPVRVGGAAGQRRAGARNGTRRCARRSSSRYLDMTRQALGAGRHVHHVARIVHAVPLRAGHRSRAAAVRRLARRESRPRCSSAATRSSRSGGRATGEAPPAAYYNAAFLVQPDGTARRRLPQDAPRAVRRVRAARSAAVLRRPDGRGRRPTSRPGTEPVLLPVGGHTASTAICYEVIYARPDARVRRDGSELLTTITNDAWYGRLVGRRTSTGSRRRCARSRRAAISPARPTPASAASSIRTDAS